MLNAITIQDPFAVDMHITLIPHVGYTEELLFSGCFPATGKAMVDSLFVDAWVVYAELVGVLHRRCHRYINVSYTWQNFMFCLYMDVRGCHCWSKLLDFHVAYYRCCCCCCYCCIEVVFRGSAFWVCLYLVLAWLVCGWSLNCQYMRG